AAPRPRNPPAVAFDVSFYGRSGSADDDATLAAAIKDAGNVILAMQGVQETFIGDHVTKYASLQFPIDSLREAAAGLGAVNIRQDPDHVDRDSQVVIEGPNGE